MIKEAGELLMISKKKAVILLNLKVKRRESIVLKKMQKKGLLNQRTKVLWRVFFFTTCLADCYFFLVWVPADKIEDLVGPLFITQPTDPPICLTTDEFDRFMPYPLPDLYERAPEPTIMQQVFVGSRVVGSTNGFAFKSSNGKYLSSDKFGVVECHSEAIGGQEEWRPVITEAGFAFESVHNKFLMIDEVAGGGFRIRADADDVGFCETFRVFCQSRFKYKPKSKSKDKDGGDSDNDLV